MALPEDPGLYQDVVGDLWRLDDDGRWEHFARRLAGGELILVEGRFTGQMEPDAFEHLATGPSVDVLPLTKISIVPDL